MIKLVCQSLILISFFAFTLGLSSRKDEEITPEDKIIWDSVEALRGMETQDRAAPAVAAHGFERTAKEKTALQALDEKVNLGLVLDRVYNLVDLYVKGIYGKFKRICMLVLELLGIANARSVKRIETLLFDDPLKIYEDIKTKIYNGAKELLSKIQGIETAIAIAIKTVITSTGTATLTALKNAALKTIEKNKSIVSSIVKTGMEKLEQILNSIS